MRDSVPEEVDVATLAVEVPGLACQSSDRHIPPLLQPVQRDSSRSAGCPPSCRTT